MIHKLFYFLSDIKRRFKDSVKYRGIYHSLIFLITETYYDRRLKLSTPALDVNIRETTEQSQFKDSHRNTPGSYYLFFKGMSKLKQNPSASHFIDIGCGTGKMLCAAMSLGFQKVTGIDLDKEGLEYAKKNCLKIKKSFPDAEFEILYADASAYKIPSTVNVIYFFSPFGRGTMLNVINNIKESYESRPRAISILYQYPNFEKEYLDAGFAVERRIKSGGINEMTLLKLG